jgi:hypothetical protein
MVRRGAGALTLLVLLAPLFDGTSPTSRAGWLLAGIVICTAGLALVLLGSLSLGRSLSPFPRPNKNARLVESGVFALVRHPIYTGFSLLGLGWSVLWTSLAACGGHGRLVPDARRQVAPRGALARGAIPGLQPLPRARQQAHSVHLLTRVRPFAVQRAPIAITAPVADRAPSRT